MSIVIEGADLSGKSTLAKSLHWEKVTCEDPTVRGRDSLNVYMKMAPGYYIWDRWWPTEYIYDKVLRGRNVCTKTDMWKFKLIADLQGAVIIYLRIGSVLTNLLHNERGDKHSLDYVMNIREGYRDFFSKFTDFLPPVYTKDQIKQALFIHEILTQRRYKWAGYDVKGWGTLEENKILRF